MGAQTDGGAIVRVLIVDDHTTFTELLTGALEREPDLVCVGSAHGVETALAAYNALVPDVVVMDHHLPDGDGLRAAAVILAADPGVRIVMLTGDPRPEALEVAAEIGICAYLPKDGSLATLLDSLRHARSGSMVVHASMLTRRANGAVGLDPRTAALTPRELSVLRLLAVGSDVRTNARALRISEHTCRGHVKSILAKLGAHSQLEAVVIAADLGLVVPGRRA